MRWIPPKILKIIGFALIGAAPFVVAFLLLPDEEKPTIDNAQIQPQIAASSAPLEFPFASPSEFPLPSEPAPSPSASPATTQCSNRRDDDRDGRFDLGDRGCSSRNDNSEAPDPSPGPSPSADPSVTPSPEPPTDNCNDNFDNDGDDLPDGADPGCEDGDGNELPFNRGSGAGPDPFCDVIQVPGCRNRSTTTITEPEPETTTTTAPAASVTSTTLEP